MKVQYIKCKDCGDIIYSRSRHDYRTCICGAVSIDGGFDYLKVSFENHPPKVRTMNIRATKKQLYDDWSMAINKYGLIKNETSKKGSSRK